MAVWAEKCLHCKRPLHWVGTANLRKEPHPSLLNQPLLGRQRKTECANVKQTASALAAPLQLHPVRAAHRGLDIQPLCDCTIKQDDAHESLHGVRRLPQAIVPCKLQVLTSSSTCLPDSPGAIT